MLRMLMGEALKLRRSMILLLIAGPPAMQGLMQAAAVATGNTHDTWSGAAMAGAAIWAYTLLPLSATALTALLAQLEHVSRGWSDILVRPFSKTAVFLSKALLCACLMAVMSGLIWAAIFLGGLAGSIISPQNALSGAPPFGDIGVLLAKMWAAALLALAIQFTLAMRFSSFPVPIIVGISGTFVAVVATSSQYGIYFPWLLPTNVLSSDPSRVALALGIGCGGGLVIFLLSSLWLARRDWR